jgi:hypothetical protein
VKGRCKSCNTNTVDVEYYVTEGGLEIFSSRFKSPRFILFDNSTPLPNRAVFRVRMKGVRYHIPYDIKSDETNLNSGSISVQTSTNHETNNESEETKLQQVKSEIV